MSATTLHFHTAFQVGPVDPRIFGGFAEHMGRCIYEGLYDPDSKHADEYGFRTDVLNALEWLNTTAMRYPGGNFVSGYHWQDGIGPIDERPTVRELAWQSIEPNHVGTDEFLRLCDRMEWTPMITVNLGTGTPEEARNWVEYCNCTPGTRYADLRTANGHAEPYGVKLWCLGNEMDAEFQIGHVPAEQYAIRAQQAAKMMKDTDRSLKLVASGTCIPALPTYMEWDRTVLEYLGDTVDYISMHRYAENNDDNTPAFLAMGNAVDTQIEQMDAVCRFSQARLRSTKRVRLCFDEWNVWYKNHEVDGAGKRAPHLIEETYNLEDALVVANFLNSFIRHADCVKIANLAQMVNVIAPIQTRGDDMLIQSIYWAFGMFSRRRNGVSLRPAIDGDSYATGKYGEATCIDTSAILGDGVLHVFLLNRTDEDHDVEIKLADRDIVSLVNAELLTGETAKTANSFESQDSVKPTLFDDIRFSGRQAHTTLPPLSLVAATFGVN